MIRTIWIICEIIVYGFELCGIALIVGTLYYAAGQILKKSRKI